MHLFSAMNEESLRILCRFTLSPGTSDSHGSLYRADCVAADWNLFQAKKDLAPILNMTTVWWGNAKLSPANVITWYVVLPHLLPVCVYIDPDGQMCV